MGNPTDFENGIIRIHKGQVISRQGFLHSLVNALYNRTQLEFKRGTFRVKGDTVDINLPYVDYGYRITFFGDEIEEIESIELKTGKRIGVMRECRHLSRESISRTERYAAADPRTRYRMKWQHRWNILKPPENILKHNG